MLIYAPRDEPSPAMIVQSSHRMCKQFANKRVNHNDTPLAPASHHVRAKQIIVVTRCEMR